MTEERIYKLAWNELLTRWSNEKDMLEKNPTDEITKFQVDRLWKELKELESMMIAKGFNK